MKKSRAETTTAKNLEERFDHGEDVLDYFDVREARVITASQGFVPKAKFAHPVTRNSKRAAVVREKSARYHKKK